MSDTRVVIFAGGVGTRMWPLSRKSTPKQFEKIVGDKSTLQLAIERIQPEIKNENIFISTGEQYRSLVSEQLSDIPKENIIGEPEMRDVAPAVGYLMAILAKSDPWGPVAILWSDHLVNNVESFKSVISTGADYIREHKEVFVFLGQKARFPNQNLGWIEQGEKIEERNGFPVHKFVSWHYRPDLDSAKEYFAGGKHSWNPGYFLVAPQFALDQYKKHAPVMYEKLMLLQESYGQTNHQEVLNKIYPTLEKISFDDAVLTKTEADKAVVLTVDLGWSDIGTWEALKEAIQADPTANITQGNVEAHQTNNSVVYNYTNQLVATVGLEGMVVVVTPDVVMVAPQEKIPEVKNMLAKFKGTDKEQYT
ncbi:mannose-1-phosphate guanylyltransferase [Candidatus Woesebacteria bacterium]|nr:mannose-1-phosphate guanylyltransferase [Candidatus Woesebacteria bacterium]